MRGFVVPNRCMREGRNGIRMLFHTSSYVYLCVGSSMVRAVVCGITILCGTDAERNYF